MAQALPAAFAQALPAREFYAGWRLRDFCSWRCRVTINPNPFLFLKKGLPPLPGLSPLQERLQLTSARSPAEVRFFWYPRPIKGSWMISFGWRRARHEKSSGSQTPCPLRAKHRARHEESSDTNYPFLASCRSRLLWVFAGSACLLFAAGAAGSPSSPTPSFSLRRGFLLPPAPSLSREGSNRSSCRSFIKEPSDHQRSGVLSFGWRRARHEKSSDTNPKHATRSYLQT